MTKQSHVWHGVAIGWRHELDAKLTQIDSTSDRIVGLKLTSKGKSILLISAYAPTSGHDDEYLEFTSNLSLYIEENSDPPNYVLIGMDSICSLKSSPRRREAWANLL